MAVEPPAATVETSATTDVEPTEGSDVQVPMASDAEESAPVSREAAAGDSTRAGGDKTELNEPQEGKEETKDE